MTVVRDGINDAVALSCADMGMAIGASTEVAVEAANVVWECSSLHDVCWYICTSALDMRTSHEYIMDDHKSHHWQWQPVLAFP